MVDSDAIYLPSSANLGTICDGGRSAYSGLLTTSINSLRSSSVSLFLGVGLTIKGL